MPATAMPIVLRYLTADPAAPADVLGAAWELAADMSARAAVLAHPNCPAQISTEAATSKDTQLRRILYANTSAVDVLLGAVETETAATALAGIAERTDLGTLDRHDVLIEALIERAATSGNKALTDKLVRNWVSVFPDSDNALHVLRAASANRRDQAVNTPLRAITNDTFRWRVTAAIIAGDWPTEPTVHEIGASWETLPDHLHQPLIDAYLRDPGRWGYAAKSALPALLADTSGQAVVDFLAAVRADKTAHAQIHAELAAIEASVAVADSDTGHSPATATDQAVLDNWLLDHPTVETIVAVAANPHLQVTKAVIDTFTERLTKHLPGDFIGADDWRNLHQLLLHADVDDKDHARLIDALATILLTARQMSAANESATTVLRGVGDERFTAVITRALEWTTNPEAIATRLNIAGHHIDRVRGDILRNEGNRLDFSVITRHFGPSQVTSQLLDGVHGDKIRRLWQHVLATPERQHLTCQLLNDSYAGSFDDLITIIDSCT